MIFKPVNGSRISNDEAELFGTRLMEMCSDNGRSVTPEDILEDAKSIASPFHDYIEWNDGVAAERYRISQCNYILRSINVEYEQDGETVEIRAFFNINLEVSGEKTSVFMPVTDISEKEELRQQIIEDALRELTNWQKRWKQYSELQPIIDAIEEIKVAQGGRGANG